MRTEFLRKLLVFSLCSIATLGIVGCDDDGPTSTTPPEVSKAVIGSGSVGSGGFLLRVGGGPGSPMGFLLSGENLRYEEGAIAVDVTVTNDGAGSAALPAALTLVRIEPDTVEVLGADNGVMGDGAAFDLAFAEDDLVWNVGEESLPLTLRFEVAQGTSVSFVARVDVGMMAEGGSIGGLIFEDSNADGLLGMEEAGIAGVTVELSGSGIATTRSVSSADGTYRFDGLAAGLYTVRTLPRPLLAHTTDVELQVLLTEDAEGEVGSYLAADFGFLFAPLPPVAPLAVGDFVEVTGIYRDDPDQIVALGVGRCRDDDHQSELRGPVTAVDTEQGLLTVMGRAVDVGSLELHGGGRADSCKDRPALDFRVGERARLRVLEPTGDAGDDALTAYHVSCWSGDKEKVRGYVEEIVLGDDDRIESFTVLGLEVVVRSSTRFHDGDDDGHDDDEDEDDD